MKRRHHAPADDMPIADDPELRDVLDKFESRLDWRGRVWRRLRQGPGQLRWRFIVRLVRRFDIPRITLLLDLLFVLYVLAVIAAILAGLFWAAYSFKVWLGIDLIPGYHLLQG